MRTHYVRHFVAAGIVALVTGVLLFPLLVNGYAMKWDMADYFLPMRRIAADAWGEGRLPLWNPYTNYGFPLHADPQTGAFYLPAALLGVLFGYDFTTLAWEYYMHVVIGGCGFYMLSRWLVTNWTVALMLGISYACSGFFIGNAQHMSWIVAGAWCPWVAYFFVRAFEVPSWKLIAPAALCMGLAATGAYPAFLIVLAYVLFAAACWYAYNRIRNKRFDQLKFSIAVIGVSCLLALAYAAFPLYSALQAFQQIDRYYVLPQVYQEGPFPISAWRSFVAPVASFIHAWVGKTDITLVNAFVGFIPLLALPFAWHAPHRKRNLALLLAAVFCLLASAGTQTPVREWLFRFAPGMNAFRLPGMFRFFTMAFLLLVAGDVFAGKKWFAAVNGSASLQTALRYVAWLLALVTLLFVVRFWKDIVEGVGELYRQEPVGTDNGWLFSVSVQLVFVLTLLLAVKRTAEKHAFGVLLMLQTFNLLLLSYPNVYVTVVSTHRSAQLDARLDSLHTMAVQDPTVTKAIMHLGDGSLAPCYYNANVFLRRVAFDGYNPFSLNAYNELTKDEPRFNRYKEMPLLHAEPGEARLNVSAMNPNFVFLFCNAEQPGNVVYQQIAYPGWRCFVNGDEQTLSESHRPFLSAPVERGVSSVRFAYRPRYLWLFWLMPLLGIPLALVTMLLLVRKLS